MKVKEFFKNKYVLFIFHALLTVLGAFVMSIAFSFNHLHNLKHCPFCDCPSLLWFPIHFSHSYWHYWLLCFYGL